MQKTFVCRLLVAIGILVMQLVTPLSAQESLHPRLLFGPDDIPGLRERVVQEPFKSVAKAMEEELNRELQERRVNPHQSPEDITRNFVPRNASWMFLITGDRKYAQLAETESLALVNDTVYWNNPSSKGLNRAMQIATVALAYDTCYHAWSVETRTLISKKLLPAANGLIASMGEGANTQIGNNWQAVRYGAAGLAALACDEPGRMEVAKYAYASLKRHLNFNLGENGWNPEGIGYTAYPWQFTGPMGVAAVRNGLGDLRTELGKKVSMTLWTALLGTVSSPRTNGLGLRADLTDDNPAYNGEGTLGMAFWSVPREYVPAVRWMHDYLTTGADGKRYFDLDRGGGIYTYLFYPADIPARNPAEVAGLNYTDASHGLAVFRNEFKDENDIVAVVNGHARQPDGAHGGPDTNTFRILGLGSLWTTGSGRTSNAHGQTNLFPGEPEAKPIGGLGKLEEVAFTPDGGGRTVTTGSSMRVLNHRRVFVTDFSKVSGAPAIFLNAESGDNARLWRLNTPEFNTIKTEGNRFILTAPNGASLVATVLEPERVTFRTGTFERGLGGDGRATGFPYRGKQYDYNKWIEFDCTGRVFVVMTLQNGAAPQVTAEKGLHGMELKIGAQNATYDRDAGDISIGEVAAKTNIAERKTPLRVRRLTARVLSDRQVRLDWLPEQWGASSITVERRTAESEWQAVGEVQPTEYSFIDNKAAPDTEYSYRAVTTNAAGRGVPSDEAEVTTWEEGTKDWVEDFAPRVGATLPARNALGHWKSAPREGHQFSINDGAGADWDAASEDGFMSIGRMPIKTQRVLFLDSIEADLSGRSARLGFAYKTESRTAFSALLQLADGTWVVSDARIESSRRQWSKLEFELAGTRWYQADLESMTRGARVELGKEHLQKVRGVGVWCNWVINDKAVQIDQFHLRARNFSRP